MVPEPTTSTTPAPEPAKRRGLFGFLFKSALGCSAFAIGSLIGFVLLLPTLLSPVVRSSAPEIFSERFHGSLEVAEVDLNWFSAQTLGGLVLRDPAQVEVARASAELPSLWKLVCSAGTRIGRVALTVDADVVADDAGVTNLARALEPKDKSASDDDDEGDAGGKGPVDQLAELELDLVLASSRLSWSDAETRRVGIPFEIRDLAANVRARPGEPFVVQAGAKVVSDSPGTLELDAKINGPIDAQKAWPFGTIDAKGRIEGFSSAMLDGLAKLEGNLREMLGPRFDLRFDATGVTPETGEVSLVFTSERTSLSFAGTFADGALRASGDSSLLATMPVPRGFIAKHVTPLVPPGASLAFGETAEPWTIRGSNLVLPIPPAGAKDMATLAPTLAALTCDVRIELPGAIGFENETTRAAGLAPSVGDVVATIAIAPGKPLEARVESAIETGTRGRLLAEIVVDDPWGPLGDGAMPPADVDVEIRDVSTAALDALAGRPGLLVEGIGPTLRIDVEAQDASLASGTIRVSATAQRLSVEGDLAIADGMLATSGERGFLVTLEPAAGWLESQAKPYLPEGIELGIAPGKVEIVARNVSVPLPAGDAQSSTVAASAKKSDAGPADPLADLRGKTTVDLSCKLPGIAVSSPETRAARLPVALSNLTVDARLEREGRLDLGVRAGLDTGTKGTLAIDASLADAWALASPDAPGSAPGSTKDTAKPLPPIDARVVVEGLSTAGIDALAGQNGRLSGAIGPEIKLTLDAKNASLAGGELALDVEASALTVRFDGMIEDGVLKTRAPEELHVEAALDEAWLARELAAHLPAGGHVRLAGGAQRALSIDVRGVAVPLADGTGKPLDTATRIERSAFSLAVRLAGLGYDDEALRAASTSLSLEGLELTAGLAPGKPLDVRVKSALDAGLDRRGTIDAAFSVPGLAAFVRDPSALPSVAGTIDVAGLPTEVLDVFAGKSGLVSKLLGPALDVHAKATAQGADAAEFDATVDSQTSRVRLAGRLAERTLVFEGERGLDLEIRLPKAWVEEHVGARLPAGARLSVPTETAPLELRVRDTRIPLPESKADAGAIAADAKSVAPKVKGAVQGTPEEVSAGTTDLPALLERLAALSTKLELVVPTLVYSDATTDAAGRALSISALKTTLEIAPEKPPLARIEGQVDSGEAGAGALVVEVRALDPLSKLGLPNGLDTFRAAIRVEAGKIPVALVDALAQQDGLLVDALGARADLTVRSDTLSLTAGAFVLDFRSDEQHAVHAEGRLENRNVQIDKVDGVVARLNLGPLVSERVVGSLVPMLVHVQKPEREPFVLAIDDLNYPLDGDLSKLDAILRLELGTVSYDLLPGLESLVGDLAQKTTALPPLKIPITKGVAQYSRLPITIAGHELRFDGSYSLVDKTMSLATTVPLSILGRKVSGEIEKLRGLLSPDLAVPIEIRGTWRQPRISVGKDFLKKVVEDAAGNQLEGFLKDAFKKKKD